MRGGVRMWSGVAEIVHETVTSPDPGVSEKVVLVARLAHLIFA